MPLVGIKDFNVLIDNNSFFDQPVKKKGSIYKSLLKISKNDDYTTGKLLDNLYHQKTIGIHLSRQRDTNIPQKINFIGKQFFYCWKSAKKLV